MRAISTQPGFLVRRLHQIHQAIFLSECADAQVTPLQWSILAIVSERPGVGQVELVEELGLDRSNVASAVKRLTQRGLLRQSDSRSDRRKKTIVISAAGRKLQQRLAPQVARAQRRLLALLPPRERRRFTEQLSRLVEHNNALSRAPVRLGD